jgi:hypothetical protein
VGSDLLPLHVKSTLRRIVVLNVIGLPVQKGHNVPAIAVHIVDRVVVVRAAIGEGVSQEEAAVVSGEAGADAEGERGTPKAKVSSVGAAICRCYEWRAG